MVIGKAPIKKEENIFGRFQEETNSLRMFTRRCASRRSLRVSGYRRMNLASLFHLTSSPWNRKVAWRFCSSHMKCTRIIHSKSSFLMFFRMPHCTNLSLNCFSLWKGLARIMMTCHGLLKMKVNISWTLRPLLHIISPARSWLLVELRRNPLTRLQNYDISTYILSVHSTSSFHRYIGIELSASVLAMLLY